MSRAPHLSIVAGNDPAARAHAAAKSGRADALLAAEGTLQAAGALITQARAVAELTLLPPGLRDQFTKLAAETESRFQSASKSTTA